MPRKLKVVIAHHEKVIADTLSMILRGSNVDASVAYSGVSALELVLSSSPDLAILCIVPAHCDDVNGVYAAVALRVLLPDCRMMLFPGGSGPWVVDPLERAHARGYDFELLPEPVHPDVLLRLVSEMTGGDIEPLKPFVRPPDVKQRATEPEQPEQPEEPDETDEAMSRERKWWWPWWWKRR